MSNATPDTRGAGGQGGERRRQRSRGGKGRNRNRNRNNNEQGNNANRGEGGGNRGNRGPRRPRKEYTPPPLTWWQKLLKAIGLYKEPVRPPRPERQQRVRFEEGPPREVKTKTRDARSEGSDTPKRRSPERSEVASARIYLGNLSYDASEEDLKELFKGVGTVRNVEIVYNRRTHRSKGYGFVDMLNVDDAKRSVEILHDQFFMGRKLVVSGAKTKDHEDGAKEEAAEDAAEKKAAAEAAATAEPAPEQAPAAESTESIKFDETTN
ncbi:RNA recognition motif domain-containing protein [Luteolibacter marinus]|uniref:RNA recognition motif domain-containing protein n=1 Tax=Luteolibacter marinus TaxID=2776705 RepID=UPI00186780F7|nr:RNA-binding protein [Luteolibacter marinus]